MSALFVTAVFSADAYACACCAEKGHYRIWTGQAASHHLEVLGAMRFAPKAELFITEADFEIIRGLEPLRQEIEGAELSADSGILGLVGAYSERRFQLDFNTKGGRPGRLTFRLPMQMVAFSADIHDGRDGGAGGPLLYKEWRFKGELTSGTGIFAAGIVRPTSFFLVFQGRGNGCDSPEDFTHWRLEINGRKAQYAFFGALLSGVPAK